MMTKVRTKFHGVLSIDVPHAGIPTLRLLQHHAPSQEIKAVNESARPFLVRLADLDLAHDSLLTVNTGMTTRAVQSTFTSEYDGNGSPPWPREHAKK